MSQQLQLPIEGEIVGSGVLLSLISTGGSAYIYKTWNESLEIHRAVKVMSPDSSPDVRDRFKTEGRINSKLQHQHIAQCFNFGETTSGLPYLEMEYISGLSIADLIHNRGPLPLSVALAISICLLDALNYAHTLKYTLYGKQHTGLIHRDLKPSNIIVTETGNIKLMDFGIARPVDVSLHTMAGTVPGTIAYMSPEACTGCDVDFRSDIYQFGLCLFEFIFGVAAFPQSVLTSLLEAKASNKYQLPSDMVKNIDSRVVPVLQRCLQLDPKLRYQSAYSCLVELRSIYDSLSFPENYSFLLCSFLAGEPVPSNHTSKVSKSNKTALSLSIFFVILLLSFIVVFHYFPNRFSLNSFTPVSSKTVSSIHADSSPTLVAHIPCPVPQKTGFSSFIKPKSVHVRDTVFSNTNSSSDAQFFITQGEQQYKEGRFVAALASFQSAIKMPSHQPRVHVIQKCVYWLAKCNTALYKNGSVPVSNYQASWRSVLSAFPSSSPEYIEASTHLQGTQN